jgi:hypothetical protein
LGQKGEVPVGTFENNLLGPDRHKHPAISSTAHLVFYRDEDIEMLENYAEKRLSANWHMTLIPSTSSAAFWVVLFYKALGSEPSDHIKRWNTLGYDFDTKRDRDYWCRVPVCRHSPRTPNDRDVTRDGKCDTDREECHRLLQNAWDQIRANNYRRFLPRAVLGDYVNEP